MKILFFISACGHGKGGHFYSLNHISRELGKRHDVKIITIGSGYSDILASNPHFLDHFTFNGLNIIRLYKHISKIIKQFQPDIYHFFDVVTYNILRFHIGSKTHKVILTKPGGPNLRFFPFVNSLILFSEEDYYWYIKKKVFKDAHLYLFSNRVKKLEILNLFKSIPKDSDSFNFVRICRIGRGYKKSIQDSINLVLYLRKRGFSNIKLYIIGTIEHQPIFNEIESTIKNQEGVITILTEHQYTKEASKMLYLADATIGTGRGFMEASSLGIPLLTINADDNYPLLVNESNFADVFRTNFSERNRIQSYNSEENLTNIEKMIKEKDYYVYLSKFSLKCFNKHFNVEKVGMAYTKLYRNAEYGPNHYLRDIWSILTSFKYHYSTYMSMKKK